MKIKLALVAVLFLSGCGQDYKFSDAPAPKTLASVQPEINTEANLTGSVVVSRPPSTPTPAPVATPVPTPAPLPAGIRYSSCYNNPIYPFARSATNDGNYSSAVASSPQSVEVYAFNTYGAAHEAYGTHRFSSPVRVSIPAGTKPVILFLSAYDSLHWEIVGATNRVQKVYLRGYHCQSTDGVSGSIVDSQSYDMTGQATYANTIGNLVAMAQGSTGLVVTKALSMYDASSIGFVFPAVP